MASTTAFTATTCAKKRTARSARLYSQLITQSNGKMGKMSPIYEYICKACNKEYSETRGITEPQRQVDCPDENCKATLYRKFGNMAVSFKGDGFYTTDKKK